MKKFLFALRSIGHTIVGLVIAILVTTRFTQFLWTVFRPFA